MMKEHYKYQKITPKIFDKIKEMHDNGASYAEISRATGIPSNTILYHLNPDYQKKHIKASKEYMKNLSKKERKRREKKYNPRKTAYYKERYHNDPDFREKLISDILKYQKNRRDRLRKEGLCIFCGKNKVKFFKTCLSCRKKRRKHDDEIK